MKIRVQREGVLKNKPEIYDDIASVVVYDDHDQPLAAVHSMVRGRSEVIMHSTADDEGFIETLRSLHINPDSVIRPKKVDIQGDTDGKTQLS